MTTTVGQFLRGKTPTPEDWVALAMALHHNPGLRTEVGEVEGDSLLLRVFSENRVTPSRVVPVTEGAARLFGYHR